MKWDDQSEITATVIQTFPFSPLRWHDQPLLVNTWNLYFYSFLHHQKAVANHCILPLNVCKRLVAKYSRDKPTIDNCITKGADHHGNITLHNKVTEEVQLAENMDICLLNSNFNICPEKHLFSKVGRFKLIWSLIVIKPNYLTGHLSSHRTSQQLRTTKGLKRATSWINCVNSRSLSD